MAICTIMSYCINHCLQSNGSKHVREVLAVLAKPLGNDTKLLGY